MPLHISNIQILIVRELFVQWNPSPYTIDSSMAISDGMTSLERRAFLSSKAPLCFHINLCG